MVSCFSFCPKPTTGRRKPLCTVPTEIILSPHVTPEEAQTGPPKQQFRYMERYCFRVLCDYSNLLCHWKRDYASKIPDEDFHPLFVEALQKQDYVDYLLDVLRSPDMEERVALIIDYGKEVSNLERRMAELAAGDTAGRSLRSVSVLLKK